MSNKQSKSLAEELERLAKLHAEGALTSEEFKKAKRLALSPQRLPGFSSKGIRRQSSRKLWGLPLWSIAVGPDLERGERRGHARGIFALGDVATGYFACGGVARGVFAIGGLAIGLFAIGGGAVGLLVALGGGAIGGLACGGGAMGAIAIGGSACGYYAYGASAAGIHSISSLHQDPEAVSFFQQFFPWLTGLIH